MSDDPLNGVSAQALAAAEGTTPPTSENADAAVEEAIGSLASSERTFASRTQDAARRRAAASRGTVEAVTDAGARIGERGRRLIDEGWERIPAPRKVLRRGRNVIQDQPSTGLLIAGAIGFGLGWLIHRRDG